MSIKWRSSSAVKQASFGMGLYGLLMIPPLVTYLESVMILHMLVQLPLLILAGWLLGKLVVEKFSHFFKQWNANGVPGILLVVFITTYWMLPRTLDESLSIWYIELFKFVSLPLLAGIFLRDSWNKLETLGKSFIYFNYLSMFALMALFYIDSPIQICNNYLEFEQKTLGGGFLMITAGMVLYMLPIVFTDHAGQQNS